MHSVLGLSDLSRSDVLVDDDGVVWFLEVNVAPGMTETSLLPQAISVAGLSVGEVHRQSGVKRADVYNHLAVGLLLES